MYNGELSFDHGILLRPDQTAENFADNSIKIIRLRDDKITTCQRMRRAEKLWTNVDVMCIRGQR